MKFHIQQPKIQNPKSKIEKIALSALVGAGMLAGLLSTAGAGAAHLNSYGDLDTSFGTGGKVTTDMNSELDQVTGMVAQPDGKLVAVGAAWPDQQPAFALIRYTTDGAVDTTFGDNGKVFTTFGRDATSNAIVRQPDGKLVVVGKGYYEGIYHETFALARYNSDGMLDTTFGNGGTVVTDAAARSEESQAFAVTLTSAGKIVVAGAVGNYDFTQDIEVAQYNSDGSLDTSFGDGGIFIYNNDQGGDNARAVTITADGKILVGGTISEGSGNDDFGALRLNANGTLDTSFGSGGAVVTDFMGGTDWGYGVANLPNGGFILGGLTQLSCPNWCERYGFGLAQYTANGSLDTSFQGQGTASYDLISSTAAYAMLRRSDGSIVMAGHQDNSEFIVGLIRPDGLPDPTFGDQGFVTTDFGPYADRANALALEPDGKIVAGGIVSVNPDNVLDSDFGLARFRTPPLGGDPTATATATHSTGGATATPTSHSGGSTPTARVSATTTHTSGGGTPTPLPTGTPGGSCSVTFSDVPAGSTFYQYVQCLSCRGILGGYSDGTFRPGKNVTRGQLAKIISNAAGFTEAVTGQTFTDIAPGSTFYPYVERMASRGIIGGYSDGTFRPNNTATRGQIAKIAANAAGFDEAVSGQSFTDVPTTSAFYPYVERMARRGIIGGYSDGTFRPNNSATRGQTAKITSITFFPDCQPAAGTK